jgi:hypothetical protein
MVIITILQTNLQALNGINMSILLKHALRKIWIMTGLGMQV